MTESLSWRRCGPCKTPILFGSAYIVCASSTCRKNVFCSTNCWEAHLGVMRHKDADFDEMTAPLELAEKTPIKASSPAMSQTDSDLSQDVLVVVSKLKNYIKAKSGFNTSGNVAERLSDIVRQLSDQAIEQAKRESRKTVMDRDFK